MRPLLALGILALSFLPLSSHASWDIWQSYVIIDSGSGNQYLAGGQNADGASAFDGAHLGHFLASNTLTLNGGELKTYKNGGSNVCGGHLQYRVWLIGEGAGSFSAVNLNYASELGGGNQKWDETGAAIDLLSGLSTPGDYFLEVYWDASGSEYDPGGCGEIKYDSDSGNNFQAIFTIITEGCMDPDACNYDDTARLDDQSCEYLSCAGCMDPSACNYDDTATIDDASCESLSCAGCTNPAYTEYDASATLDDGSCQTLADPCITAITASFDLDFGQPDNDLSTGDDEYSTVALPFTFDFSGTAYSSVTISSNGVLNFGPSGVDDTEPSALEDYEADIILGAHHDLNPSTSASSLISYGVNGTAPNRAFVASWRGIPSYSDNNLLHNFQIVLYEASNVIEIWNGGHPYIPFGYITIGIAREDGTGIGPSNYNDEALAAGKWSFTPDGSGGHVQAQSSNSALSLESIVVDISATTIDAADGHASLLVNSGNPTAVALAGVNGAPDYSFDQPGSIDGIASGVYNVTATDDSGCESNALTLVMTYALCCDCGVSDIDTDGICDDEDNCTDRTAPNYDDPNNTDCILGDD